MTDTKNYIGATGEALACQYLTGIGYEITERNFRCKEGEIDIIAEDGNVTVFIEVKTRSYRYDGKFGSARSAVTLAKQKKFTSAAQAYIKLFPEAAKCRTDVIEVYINSGKPIINHLKSCRFALR